MKIKTMQRFSKNIEKKIELICNIYIIKSIVIVVTVKKKVLI